MKEHKGVGATFLALFVVLTIGGCTVMQSRPNVPTRPQPLSSFSVEFVPAGAERYPPTDVTKVKSFKAVLNYPGLPDEIRGGNEKPTRPYVKVGELRFGKN